MTGLIVPYLGGFIPANEASVEVYQVLTQFIAIEVSSKAFVVEAAPIFTWMNLLWAVYLLGGIVVFSRFVHGLNRIYNIYKEADKTPQANYTLVESNKYHLPFSFFHFIFVSKQLSLNEEVEKVLRHEELHAYQWHSLDIVFTELLQVFFWFNPILIMYKGALRQSHEYLADAYVTQDYNKNSYGQLLLQQSTSGLEIALANQFFHSQIKKRITMMYKEKSKRSAMVKYLVAVPVLVAMLIIFSSNQGGELAEGEVLARLEQVDSSLKKEIKEKLKAKGIDVENIDHNDPIQLEKIEDALNDILKTSFDFDIRVEKNGVYTFPPTDKRTDDINEYFKSIKAENRSIVIDVDPEAKNQDVVILLNCANNLEIEIILNKGTQFHEIEISPEKLNLSGKSDLVVGAEHLFGLKSWLMKKDHMLGRKYISVLANGAYMHDNTPITEQEVIQIIDLIKEKDGQLYIKANKGAKWKRVSNLLDIAAQMGVQAVVEQQKNIENFEGRTFTKVNWNILWSKYRSIKGKVTIKAEANANGDIIRVEIVNDKTTINNKVILEDALKAAKAFEVEKASKSAIGEIVFNLGGIKPHQGHIFDPAVEEFKFNNAINLGEQVPEGSVEVRIKDKLLTENKDYTIDYLTGKLALNKDYDGKASVNVTFKEAQGDPIFKVVEEMPRFPGCEDMEGATNDKEQCAKQKMLEFVYSNLTYPAKARDAGVEGMCVVQFVVEKDGSVAEAKLVRDIGADCGVETMKVVRSFPTWIPGKQKGKAVRVQYNLPVKFKLEGGDKPTNIEKLLKGKTSGISINGEEDRKIHLKTSNSNQPEPLYVIDEKVQESTSVKSINPDDIKSMNVLKGEKAIEKYGEDGKNGVVEINLKPNEQRKEYTYKTSLKYTADQFKEVKDIAHLLRDVGLKAESKAEILSFRIVRIQERKDAEPLYSNDGTFNQEVKDLIQKTKVLDRYFFEDITIKIDGKEDNIGAISIMIVDGMPGLVNSLVVVNGKTESSDRMSNINPNDIAKMDVLKGEKMIEKYGDIPHNSVIEITLKPEKEDTNIFIEPESNKLNSIKFSTSPNPSDGNFNVIYQLEKNIPANLTFYSIDGTVIKRMLNLPAENNINVDLSNQNLPLIYITLEQDGKTKTIKATFQK